MSGTNQFNKNLIVSLVSMVIQFLQSLVVTSYVQRVMGVEAYGYMAVVVNIVNAAGVLTVALTSVCSKYMVVELQKQDQTSAAKLFSTLCTAIFVVVTVCGLFFIIVTANLTDIMVIAPAYVEQVKILMLIVGASFLFQLVQVPYLSVFYYEEKLYIYYGLTILSNCIKIMMAVMIFNLWQPVVWAAYIGTLIADVLAFCVYYSYVKKHYRYLKIEPSHFSKTQLKGILKSGVWVSISKLGAILLSTCSTYLVNILISPYLAGVYGTIAQLQSILSFITIAIVNVYLPKMYKLFADKDTSGLVLYTKDSLKIISSFLGFVVGGLVVFGNEFVSIWITPDYLQFDDLLIISVCTLHVTYSAELVNQLLITVDKTKISAILSIVAGVVNIILAVVLINLFDIGVYGIAVAQLVVGVLRAGIALPAYAAHQLRQNKLLFVRNQLKGYIPMLVTVIIGTLVNHFITVSSWLTLIVACGITGVVALVIFFVIDKDMRGFVSQFARFGK